MMDPRRNEGLINKLYREMRHNNYVELHVEEVEKRGNHYKIRDSEYKLSKLDTRKNEIL